MDSLTSRFNKLNCERDVFVGLRREVEELEEHLVRGSRERHVLSMVGMGGLGKTTLAKKLYDDSRIADYFNVRAWSTVSQSWREREILLDILRGINEGTDNVSGMSDEDLAEKLYKSLKGRRYLIVLDDIWEIGPWYSLKRSFPDDNNGSRILITTRQHNDVALHAGLGSKTYTLEVGFLQKEESWELLQKKVFSQDSCPPELLQIGKEVAKRCKGVPLVLVVIAGILTRVERRPNIWEEVAENIRNHISDGPTKVMGIMEFSYKQLPEHLKLCFKYFGAFPEDREISASRLKRLWIGEGFVQGEEGNSLLDIAESYLNDLIGRNLVVGSRTRSKRRVKTLHIHDVLRDLSLMKAKEENFFQIIDDENDNCAAPPHRLVFRFPEHLEERNYDPCVRSLLCFLWPSNMYYGDVSIMFGKMKLLIILDLLDLRGVNISGIEPLSQLRYLALSPKEEIPSFIDNLSNLQVLLLQNMIRKYKMPDTFWKLEKLTCCRLNDRYDDYYFLFPKDMVEGCSKLLRLEDLSRPYLFHGDHTEKILKRLPNLRKLNCVFGESWDSSMNCNRFPPLDLLKKLESLVVLYEGVRRYPVQLRFPVNLKKLELSRFRLPWKEISQIAQLRYLEVLKLKEKAFEGEQWDLEEGDFPKLRYLKLSKIRFWRWNVASCYVFSCLELLELRSCFELEEIPFEFSNIDTLGKIEIVECSDSVSLSAKQILEDKVDNGDDFFSLVIKNSLGDDLIDSEGVIKLFPRNADSFEQFTSHCYGGALYVVACNPVDSRLVATSGDDGVFLYSLGEKDWGCCLSEDINDEADNLAFSTDGQLLVSRSKVWNIFSRNLQCELGLK